MITLAKERYWEHPESGERLDLAGLLSLLRQEAARIMEELGGSLRLHVHLLDLRPRLATEAKRRPLASASQ